MEFGILKFPLSGESTMGKWFIGSILIFSIFVCIPIGQGEEKSLDTGELYDSSMELYYKGKCEEAMEGFSKVIHSSPTSKLVSYSQYMMGLCYLKMEKYREALEQFEVYLKTYPDGDRVKEAEKGIQISEERLKALFPLRSKG